MIFCLPDFGGGFAIWIMGISLSTCDIKLLSIWLEKARYETWLFWVLLLIKSWSSDIDSKINISSQLQMSFGFWWEHDSWQDIEWSCFCLKNDNSMPPWSQKWKLSPIPKLNIR